MIRRTAPLAAALVTLISLSLTPPLYAQGLEYADGTIRYRITSSTRGSQVSPTATQDFTAGIRQLYTVRLVRQARDTLRETVTIDSISIEGSTGAPDVANLVGTTFSALLSPTGTLYSAKSPEVANPMVSQLSETIARFLPVVRGTLTPGAAWSDTTRGKVTQQGIEMDRTIVADYAVLGDTTLAGERAVRLRRLTSITTSAAGATQDTPRIEGAIRSDARLYLTQAGVYLGGRSSDDIRLTLRAPARNAEISITQQVQTTIEAIR